MFISTCVFFNEFHLIHGGLSLFFYFCKIKILNYIFFALFGWRGNSLIYFSILLLIRKHDYYGIQINLVLNKLEITLIDLSASDSIQFYFIFSF